MTTSSASPASLRGYVKAASAARDVLSPTVAAVREVYARVVPRLVDFPFPESGALGGLVAHLDAAQARERFVGGVEEAFSAADSGILMVGGATEIEDQHIDRALRRGGIGAPPGGELGVEAPELLGQAPSSGFAADPVCTANGNFLLTEEDLPMPGRAGLISWQRSYSSRAAAEPSGVVGGHGRGWTSWADTALVLTASTVGWRGLDGARSTLDRPAPGETTPIPLLGAVLAVTDDGFLVEHAGGADRGGQTWHYDREGLPRLVSTVHDEARLEWDGRQLRRVSHPRSDRWLEIEWSVPGTADGDEAPGTPGHGDLAHRRIVAVRTSDGRTARYGYDESADLVRADGGPAGARHYESADGLLVAVTDDDGVTEARTTYDEAGRAVEQVTADSRTIRFAYHPGYRVVVWDADGGPVNTYRHDADGRLVAVVDAAGRTFRRSFDAAGRLVGLRERSGAAWTMTYDDAGNLVCRVGPGGLSESWTYDDLARMSSHTDAAGAVARWAYAGGQRTAVEVTDAEDGVTRVTVGGDDLPTCITDADGVSLHLSWDRDGQLVRVRGAEGVSLTIRYDAAGEPVAVVDAAGVESRWERGPTGQVSALVSPLGRVTRFEYSPAGRLTTYEDPAGARWRIGHGPNGRPSQIVDPAEAMTAFGYDRCGQVTSVVGPDGGRHLTVHDGLGRPVEHEEPGGARTRRRFDPDGRLVAETDPEGTEWSRGYDEAGRLTSVTAADGEQAVRYSYDDAGNVVTRTDPGDATYRFEYDRCGRVTAETDPEGRRTALTWTAAGRLAAVTSPGGHATRYGYDRAGRLNALHYPSGLRLLVSRDAAGRLAALTASTGVRLTCVHNEVGELVGVVRPDGQQITIHRESRGLPTAVATGAATRQFDYDDRGLLVGVTDPLGATTRYRYDKAGRLAAWTDPLQGVWSVAHDQAGRVKATTDPLGRTTTLTHDRCGRLVERRFADGSGQRWWRDHAGRVVGLGAPGGTAPEIRLEYGPAGRLVTAQAPDRRDVRLRYNRAGLLVSRTTAAGRLAWTYDANGAVATVSRDGADPFRFHRDADGQLTSVEHPLLGTCLLAGAADGDPVDGDPVDGDPADDGFSVDDFDKFDDYLDAAVPDSSIVRDRAGQLVEVSGAFGWQRFQWDRGGRRAGEDGPAGHTAARYDAAGQLTELRRPDGVLVRFGYDAAGRRIAEDAEDGSSTTYRWDPLGRLAEVRRVGRDGAVTTPLVTDALGDPLRVDGIDVLWDPTFGFGEVRGLGAATVAWAGTTLGVLEPEPPPGCGAGRGPGGARWVPAGPRRSGAGLDLWGLPSEPGVGDDGSAEPPDPVAARLAYRGELAVGGLVWQRARVLDPATRSFLSPDPLPHVPGLPGAANPYHFAWNDPTTFSDPTGLRPIADSDFAVYRTFQTGPQSAAAGAPLPVSPGGTGTLPQTATLTGAAVAAPRLTSLNHLLPSLGHAAKSAGKSLLKGLGWAGKHVLDGIRDVVGFFAPVLRLVGDILELLGICEMFAAGVMAIASVVLAPFTDGLAALGLPDAGELFLQGLGLFSMGMFLNELADWGEHKESTSDFGIDLGIGAALGGLGRLIGKGGKWLIKHFGDIGHWFKEAARKIERFLFKNRRDERGGSAGHLSRTTMGKRSIPDYIKEKADKAGVAEQLEDLVKNENFNRDLWERDRDEFDKVLSHKIGGIKGHKNDPFYGGKAELDEVQRRLADGHRVDWGRTLIDGKFEQTEIIDFTTHEALELKMMTTDKVDDVKKEMWDAGQQLSNNGKHDRFPQGADWNRVMVIEIAKPTNPDKGNRLYNFNRDQIIQELRKDYGNRNLSRPGTLGSTTTIRIKNGLYPDGVDIPVSELVG